MIKKQQQEKTSDTSILQHFQVSFYGNFINDFACTNELTSTLSDFTDRIPDFTWDGKEIPEIYTPVNTISLLKNHRLIMIVWYLDESTGTQQTIGQLNINLDRLKPSTSSENHLAEYDAYQVNLINTNKVVGQVDFKMIYKISNSGER